MCKIKDLKQAPFTSYSAENELEILSGIFYEPPFYSSLKAVLKSGNTRFILGQRGHGKSILIRKIREDLYREGCLPVLIEEYDGIPIKNNESYFLFKIVQSVTMAIAEKIVDRTLFIDKVDSTLKEKFGVLVEMFYDDKWSPSFMEKLENIKSKKRWNRIKNIFNQWLKRPLDAAGTIAINVVAELASEIVNGGRREFSGSAKCRELFPEFNIHKFESLTLPEAPSIPIETYKRILRTLKEFIQKTRLESFIVLFDKVDEFSPLQSNTKKIAGFVQDMLLDTDLLYQTGIVFSLWSGIRNELNKNGVRFDKFPPIDIRWEDVDLEQIVDSRLRFYSKNPNTPVTFQSIVRNESLRKTILTLAERSPRNILILLNDIQSQESQMYAECFSNEAIEMGMMKFCKNFDFLSARPAHEGKRENIKSWINKLLAIRSPYLTNSNYQAQASVTPKTAHIHFRQLQEMELIQKQPIPSENKEYVYEVTDPRIIHLMSRGVTFIE